MEEEIPGTGHRVRKKRYFIGVGIILALIAAGMTWYFVRPPSSPIPKNISETVIFPLFYPTKLPTGYVINKTSFHSDNQVVLYSLTKSGAPNIVITVQSKPNGFDFSDFKDKQLRSSKSIANDAGDTVVGLYADRIVGSLLSDKSWVLVNAPSKVSAKDIETVMKSLRQKP